MQPCCPGRLKDDKVLKAVGHIGSVDRVAFSFYCKTDLYDHTYYSTRAATPLCFTWFHIRAFLLAAVMGVTSACGSHPPAASMAIGDPVFRSPALSHAVKIPAK
jgi:hypothetical protein